MRLIRLAAAALLACTALQAAAQHALDRDRPPRRLQISVRFDSSVHEERYEASGRISSRSSSFRLRGQAAGAGDRVDQRVQVLEGRRAVIYTGRSRPARQRQYIQTPAGVIPQQITVVQDETTGFAVVPRLAGDIVLLDISSYGASGDSARSAQASVSARLGEWIELGRIGSSSAYRLELRGVSLRVDEVPR